MGAPQYEQAGADIGGTGTTNTIPRWTGASTLGDSIIVQNAGGTAIAIGDAAGVSYVGLVQVKRAGGAGWLTLDHTGGSYAEVQSYNVPLYLNRQGNNTILNATSGNVGIGTASPGYKLDVSGDSRIGTYLLAAGSVFSEATIVHSSVAAGSRSTNYALTTNATGNDTVLNSGNTLYFRIANTERARIDSSGNLLMAGNGTAANPIIANSTGVSGMYFPSATTVAIAANGGIAATFSKAAGAGVALGGTTGLVFDASGSQQGIKLRATPDSTDTQTLDCYQDGGASAGGLSWTPTLSAAATWGGTAPTVTNARYTRIGNLVFCTVTLDATGAVAFSSTYGSSTISSPAGLSATASTTVPSNRAGVSANGAQGGTTVYVPTYASNTTVINLTWFFAV